MPSIEFTYLCDTSKWHNIVQLIIFYWQPKILHQMYVHINRSLNAITKTLPYVYIRFITNVQSETMVHTVITDKEGKDAYFHKRSVCRMRNCRHTLYTMWSSTIYYPLDVYQKAVVTPFLCVCVCVTDDA